MCMHIFLMLIFHIYYHKVVVVKTHVTTKPKTSLLQICLFIFSKKFVYLFYYHALHFFSIFPYNKYSTM